MARTYLIASYPKSGNTWIRLMLDSWRRGGLDMRSSLIGSITCRNLFDDILSIDSEDLRPEEILALRPHFHRMLATRMGDLFWYKSHDAQMPVAQTGEMLFPDGSLDGVVLVVRDPRDVASSFAAYMGLGLDQAITQMETDGIRPAWASRNIPQIPYGWSRFHQSWLDWPGAKLVVRYEDLLEDPAGWLGRVLDFSGLSHRRDDVERAAQACAFQHLRGQEIREGFHERPPSCQGLFFRRGSAGQWRHELTAAQVDRIEASHHAMMAQLGYAPSSTAEGRPQAQ